MKKRHKLLCPLIFLYCVSVLLCATFPVCAETPTAPTMQEAGAVSFYHVESNTVICEKNATQSVAAGSSVKVMAGLLFCEALDNRQTEQVFITSEMVAQSKGRRLYIEAGDTISVQQLLYAAICGSYNDAYDVLASYVADTKDAFVAQMNARAIELGAIQTQFTDPSGIDDSSQTTAADMGKIALAASQNALYMELCNTVRYAFEATDKLNSQTLYNPNALLSSSTTQGFYNSLCKGMSAGLTTRAGGCVISYISNGSESYIAVILGGTVTQDAQKRDVNHAYNVINDLSDWVYDAYAYIEVVSPNTTICTIPVTVSDLTSQVEIRTTETRAFYLPKNLEIGKEITYSIRLIYDELEAPVTEGTFVGYLAILLDGETLDTVPLYTTQSAERSSFVSSLKRLQTLTGSRAFLAGAIFFVVVMIAWITVETWLMHRTRHKWDKYFSMKMSPTPDTFNDKKRKK